MRTRELGVPSRVREPPGGAKPLPLKHAERDGAVPGTEPSDFRLHDGLGKATTAARASFRIPATALVPYVQSRNATDSCVVWRVNSLA
mmetsp:Transcript_863/g.3327  ORF Transcript_863/g.3327 Transcript_863/m.3327 type:complete len:88 (+) Transcript_863:1268-1531(+)